jgi:hypothetical protein
MTEPQKKKRVWRAKLAEIELVPDAWPKFERFIREIAKAGPQHRPSAKPKTRPVSKGRVRKGRSRT